MRKSNIEEHEDDFFGGQRRTAQIKVIQKFIGKLKVDNKNFEALLNEYIHQYIFIYIQDGDDYIINGGKMWITNGAQADWLCVLANTSEGLRAMP